MPIITLTTDYGFQSHYLVKLKARLLTSFNGVNIVDIMHNAVPFHLTEATFMLKNTIFDFPENTIHFMTIGAQNIPQFKFVLAVCNGQYVIAPDNGFVGLIFGDLVAQYYYIQLPYDENKDAVREIYCGVAEELMQNNFQINPSYFTPLTTMILTSGENIVKHPNSMRIPVSYVDNYGNAFSNLSKKEFYEFLLGENFAIRISRDEYIRRIHRDYNEVPKGVVLARFGEEDQLHIAINGGNASQLFQLKKGNYFIIEK